MATGADIPSGWTAQAWCERLRQLADRCCDDHRDLAEQYRQWAAKIEEDERERD